MRPSLPLLITSLLVPGLAAGAFGQGADSCSMAQPISGTGPQNFDTTAATTDGLPTLNCGDIFNDVWFAFTAADTSTQLLTLCGGASHDTKIAVYDGSCAGAELACNDDVCGLQSELTFNTVAGQVYILRIGNFTDGVGGPGTFRVAPLSPVVNPGTGNAYLDLPGNLSWEEARAAAENTFYQGSAGHLVTFETQAELDWVVANVPYDRPWIGLFHDPTAPGFMEPDIGWRWVTGEIATFLNWFPGEPNNTSASAGPEDYAELFGTGEWNDAELFHAQTSSYMVEWGGGFGVPYCSNTPNTTGQPGLLSASGSPVASDNDFTLTGSQLPDGEFCFFLASRTQGFIANPNSSQGNLCVLGDIARFNLPGQLGQTANGQYSLQIPLDMVPEPPLLNSTVMAGETWNFQLWYRDFLTTGPTSNFTEGLEVTFE